MYHNKFDGLDKIASNKQIVSVDKVFKQQLEGIELVKEKYFLYDLRITYIPLLEDIDTFLDSQSNS